WTRAPLPPDRPRSRKRSECLSLPPLAPVPPRRSRQSLSPEGQPAQPQVSAVAPVGHPPSATRLQLCHSDSLIHADPDELQQRDVRQPERRWAGEPQSGALLAVVPVRQVAGQPPQLPPM